MPRAPHSGLSLSLSLLLMAALASFVAATTTSDTTTTTTTTTTPPLEIINPWLSACDLQPASATDLQGACSATMWGPGSSLCPPPCPANSTTQCLYYLKESHKEEVCGRNKEESPESRRRALQGLRMRHCCEHAVDSALPDIVFDGGDVCREHLDALLEVDALAARISCEFAEVLTRYDCTQTYSINYHCEDCKEAYRRWVCSSLVPNFVGPDLRVRPCLNVCQNVEQQCPYMLPGDRAPAHPTQYAGEPTFLCLDPNIPETGEQRTKSSVGDEDCCYTHCGSPGRGLCVNCSSGRPSNGTREPVPCAAATATKSSGCGKVGGAPSSSGAASRTHKVQLHQLLWTAWIHLLMSFARHQHQTIIITTNNTLKCLLLTVLCAVCCCISSVRTPFLLLLLITWLLITKTKRKKCWRRRTSCS